MRKYLLLLISLFLFSFFLIPIADASSVSIHISKNWNLISSPFEEPIKISDIAKQCNLWTSGGKVWAWSYDSENNKWIQPDQITKDEGVYVLSKQDCDVPLTGTPATFSSKELKQGWNLFSTETSWNETKGDCVITSNPALWEYDSEAESWTHPSLTEKLNPSKGYWVAVKNDCSLSVSGCVCTDWQNQGCGQGSCAEDEMYQTITCTPSGCTRETDERCVSLPECEMTEVNLLHDIKPLLQQTLDQGTGDSWCRENWKEVLKYDIDIVAAKLNIQENGALDFQATYKYHAAYPNPEWPTYRHGFEITIFAIAESEYENFVDTLNNREIAPTGPYGPVVLSSGLHKFQYQYPTQIFQGSSEDRDNWIPGINRYSVSTPWNWLEKDGETTKTIGGMFVWYECEIRGMGGYDPRTGQWCSQFRGHILPAGKYKIIAVADHYNVCFRPSPFGAIASSFDAAWFKVWEIGEFIQPGTPPSNFFKPTGIKQVYDAHQAIRDNDLKHCEYVGCESYWTTAVRSASNADISLTSIDEFYFDGVDTRIKVKTKETVPASGDYQIFANFIPEKDYQQFLDALSEARKYGYSSEGRVALGYVDWCGTVGLEFPSYKNYAISVPTGLETGKPIAGNLPDQGSIVNSIAPGNYRVFISATYTETVARPADYGTDYEDLCVPDYEVWEIGKVSH